MSPPGRLRILGSEFRILLGYYVELRVSSTFVPPCRACTSTKGPTLGRAPDAISTRLRRSPAIALPCPRWWGSGGDRSRGSGSRIRFRELRRPGSVPYLGDRRGAAGLGVAPVSCIPRGIRPYRRAGGAAAAHPHGAATARESGRPDQGSRCRVRLRARLVPDVPERVPSRNRYAPERVSRPRTARSTAGGSVRATATGRRATGRLTAQPVSREVPRPPRRSPSPG